MIGLIVLVPPLVANTLGIINKNSFGILWSSWFDILQILWYSIILVGFIILFSSDKKIKAIPFILSVGLFIYLIPNLIIPEIVQLLDSLVEVNYIFMDMVLPSILLSVSLLGFGLTLNKYIFIQQVQ